MPYGWYGVVMNLALQELAQDLSTTSNLEQFWTRINQELSKFGVSSIFYGAIATQAELALGTQTKSIKWKCNHTHEFTDYFGLEHLVDNCKSFEHTLKETVPFIWHDESLWEDATSEQRAQAYAERDMGLYVGITLPTTHFSPSHYGGIGVSMGEVTPEEFEKIWPEKHAELIQVLTLLDTGMREQHLSEIIGLAPREKETLEWLVAGLRPDQIAHRMGIGYRTVDKYINKAKQKLNARTRDQAVAKALIFNAIDV